MYILNDILIYTLTYIYIYIYINISFMKQGGTSRSRTMGTRLACGVKAYPTPMVRTEQQARFFLSFNWRDCLSRPSRPCLGKVPVSYEATYEHSFPNPIIVVSCRGPRVWYGRDYHRSRGRCGTRSAGWVDCCTCVLPGAPCLAASFAPFIRCSML
jgi:hypothetical protein